MRYTHKIVITIYTTPLKQIKSSKSHVRNILLHNLKFKKKCCYRIILGLYISSSMNGGGLLSRIVAIVV